MLKVALLCSRRAPGLSFLLNEDRNRGRLYDLVCCLSSEEQSEAREEAERAGLPYISHPISRFSAARGTKRTDLRARVDYDRETLALLAPHPPDLLVLSSYLLIVTEPLLSAFPDRIVNVHHADLTKQSPFVGLRAVRDAIFAGETETRATAHLVTERLDEGEILALSEPFPVSPLVPDALSWGATDILKAYAYAHQEWMIRTAWGPLISEAIARVRVRELEGVFNPSAARATRESRSEMPWGWGPTAAGEIRAQ
jgi:folate-dependent phosphoribosylglycinamide formyltransferase PurN